MERNVTAVTPRKSISDPKAILWPQVLDSPDAAKLKDDQFAALEAAGRIVLNREARRALNNVARAWAHHDRVLHSPRPAEFRGRLKSMRASVEGAYAETDLIRTDATMLDQHLYHWLLDQDPAGTNVFLRQLGELPAVIEFLRRVEESLPSVNCGTARPMEEGRFIRYLADQFEKSGGRASGYATAHNPIFGYAATPFRAFVHQFYALLPLRSKRRRSGLDAAICRALKGRPRKKIR
jgi:hypothetical protein